MIPMQESLQESLMTVRLMTSYSFLAPKKEASGESSVNLKTMIVVAAIPTRCLAFSSATSPGSTHTL